MEGPLAEALKPLLAHPLVSEIRAGAGLLAAVQIDPDAIAADPSLPARAAVGKEHIETEMRAASGIIDGDGKFVAGVVLITAGYSADGKYSHYLVTQVPLQIGSASLPPGEYVFGWQRDEDSLNVHFYEAATGAECGSAKAARLQGNSGVESFKVWPPQTRSIIQIGRFGIPYQLHK